MGYNRIQRILSVGVLSTVGLVTGLGHIYHFTQEQGFHELLLGVLIPLGMSLLLIGVGVWLYRSEFETACTMRIAGWAGLGMLARSLTGYVIIPYQNAHGAHLVDIPFLVFIWLTTGALVGVLVGYYDITQRRYRVALETEQSELRAREQDLQQKSERLQTFASILSHDLRNPLNVAMNRLELAQRTDEPSQLEKVDSALQRMESIIEDTLTIAREGDNITDGELETTSLSDLARTSWTTCNTSTADLEIDADLQLRADPNRLQHVFENLYRNAIDHSDGQVTIRVGALPSRDGFYVEDDGPGIPDSERDQVFDPSYTTRSNGTGYGLNIVKTITNAHGWEVTISEGADGGARFEFTGVKPTDQ